MNLLFDIVKYAALALLGLGVLFFLAIADWGNIKTKFLMKLLPAKRLDEPVYAWRFWNYEIIYKEATDSITGKTIMEEEYHLVGWYGGHWPQFFMDATCYRGHKAPSPFCHCGIYAFKIDQFIEECARYVKVPLLVFGRVALSGDIVEHDLGYRAGRADIVELITIERPEEAYFKIDVFSELQKSMPKGDIPIVKMRPSEFIQELETLRELEKGWRI